jgi:Na+-driven multidrug efflux pump
MSDNKNPNFPSLPIQNVDLLLPAPEDPDARKPSNANPGQYPDTPGFPAMVTADLPLTYTKIIADILWNGTLGALVFLLLICALLVMFIFAGRLPDSQVFVSAIGIGSAYFGVGSSIAFGLNAGFNVLCSRCNGIQDWLALANFLKKQFIFINGFNVILFVYVLCCVFWFGEVYSHCPALVYWLRVFMVLCYPSMVMIFNVDIFREMFIGLRVFGLTFFAELSVVIIGAIVSYLLCYVADFQFYGLLWGLFIGQTSGLAFYYTYFLKGPEFQDFHNIHLKQIQETRASDLLATTKSKLDKSMHRQFTKQINDDTLTKEIDLKKR